MKQQTTIKDLAKALRISVSTVSRAMRDTHDVSEETRALVLQKAKELNYVPNVNATALKRKSTKKIGIVIPQITNHYLATVITSVQEVAQNNGYSIVLYISNDDAELQSKILAEINSTLVDGLLICISADTIDESPFSQILNRGVPLVFFDRVLSIPGTSRVMQDDYTGAFQAVEHLIEKGYRKIAHITGPQHLLFTQKRLQGYLDALQKHQLDYNPSWLIHSGFSHKDGINDAKALLALDDLPDSIFAVSDRKAIASAVEVRKSGIQIGKNFGIIGFTNDPITELFSPSLSTLHEPASEIGRKSCELLLKHILKKNFEGNDLTLSCILIERESTQKNVDRISTDV